MSRATEKIARTSEVAKNRGGDKAMNLVRKEAHQ